MKKRIRLLAFAAVLTLSLCACGTPEASAPSTEAPASAPTGQSDPVDTSVQAEAIATEPADPNALVSDMYHGVFTNSEGEEFPHAVPRINLDGEEIAALNDTIYQTFVAEGAENFDRSMYGPNYRYYEIGDLLTVFIENTMEGDSYPAEYTIYTIRLSDAHILTREEILEAADMSEAEFEEAASVAMGHAYCNFASPAIDFTEEDFVREQFSKTVGAENVAKAEPYFEKDGTLAVRGYIYQLAGGACHEELISLTNYEASDLYGELLNGVTE